jgi:hypothetical protein
LNSVKNENSCGEEKQDEKEEEKSNLEKEEEKREPPTLSITVPLRQYCLGYGTISSKQGIERAYKVF